jgi:hypothetical protein
MKFRPALILLASLALLPSTTDIKTVYGDSGNLTAQRRSAPQISQSSTGDESQARVAFINSVHVEPLLLLLLGSTLFSIGMALKLVLSKRLDPKPMTTVERNKLGA